MMKKKLFSLAVTLVMALSLAVPAMAAGTGSITVTNATVGQTYAGYKIFDATYSGENVAYTIDEDSQFYSAVSGATDVFTLTESSVDGVYNVAAVQGADVLAWVKGLSGTFTADLTAVEADSDTVVWNEVPYGYYYITSSLGTLITVDSNLPNVEVIDKNQQPGGGATKTTNGNEEDYQIGEVIPFTITFTATNYDGETAIENYYVDDIMAPGMELVADSIDVAVDGDSEVLFTATDDAFPITIPWQADGEFLYDSPSTVTVTYKAVLTATAAIDGEGLKNTAKITWTGTPGGDEVIVEDTVYTYALAVKKVDKAGNPLAGATFVLKDATGAEVKVSGENGVYTVDPNGTATIVSPESGLIVIKGVDSDKYTLTETAAPEGFNLLTKPVEVTPTKTGVTNTNVTKYLDEEGNVVDTVTDVSVEITADVAATPVVVVNFSGTELPSTGGMGTTIFYVVGGTLVVAAAVLLITKKRMNNAED